jgi:hypothetical protein
MSFDGEVEIVVLEWRCECNGRRVWFPRQVECGCVELKGTGCSRTVCYIILKTVSCLTVIMFLAFSKC